MLFKAIHENKTHQNFRINSNSLDILRDNIYLRVQYQNFILSFFLFPPQIDKKAYSNYDID